MKKKKGPEGMCQIDEKGKLQLARGNGVLAWGKGLSLCPAAPFSHVGNTWLFECLHEDTNYLRGEASKHTVSRGSVVEFAVCCCAKTSGPNLRRKRPVWLLRYSLSSGKARQDAGGRIRGRGHRETLLTSFL